MTPRQRTEIEDDFEPEFARFYDDGGASPLEDYTDEDMSLSDQTIENVIKEIFSNSKKLKDHKISIKVDHTDVTLTGSVKSDEEKYLAESLVHLIHGVGLIKNRIVVS
jgi:osmotically-inducible protein OsmY